MVSDFYTREHRAAIVPSHTWINPEREGGGGGQSIFQEPRGIGSVRPRINLEINQPASVRLGGLVTQAGLELAVVIPTLNERANVSVLVQRLANALNGISWEAIFVDDDSADGTIDEVRRFARSDARIRGIRRISRRGLAGAALEGMLSTTAKFIVVMDGDLQHDETRIAEMLPPLRNREADIVVASRYCEAGQNLSGLSKIRHFESHLATWLAEKLVETSLPVLYY